MSAMFEVHVLDKDEKKGTVTFELIIINPAQRSFYNTKSFALLLLLDSLHSSSVSNPSLFNEIPRDKILDVDLNVIRKKESSIIKKVDVVTVENFPVTAPLDSMTDEEQTEFWSDKKNLPRAILSVTVKDPAFISHLQKGQRWESGAFNVI